MDILKSLGIKVGDGKILIKEDQRVCKSSDESKQIIRKGIDHSGREQLESQLSKGLAKSTDAFGKENLNNTHGENFHSDNDKEVEQLQKDLKEVCNHKSEVFTAINDLIKSKGEGSRGGKVIGHTRSGKPIYENHNHPSHKDFSEEDHHDASIENQRLGHRAKRDLANVYATQGQEGVSKDKDAKMKNLADEIRARKMAEDHHSVEKLKERQKRGPSLVTKERWKGSKEEASYNKKSLSEELDDLIKSDSSKKKDLIKSKGEGSRGGKIIGHTKSGRPIYEHHVKQAMKDHHSGRDNFGEMIEHNRKAKADANSDSAHYLTAHSIVKEAAYSKHGLLGNHKSGRVTMKDIKENGPSKGHSYKSLDVSEELDDLIKAKYVKREKKNGKWVYYYKNPDGSLRTGEKGSINRKQQAEIRRERTKASGKYSNQEPLDQTGLRTGSRYELSGGKAGAQNKIIREKLAKRKASGKGTVVDPKESKIHEAAGKKHLEDRANKKKAKESHMKNSHHEKISSAHKELSDLEKKGWHGTPEHRKAEDKHINAIQGLANNLAHPIKDPEGHASLIKELHAAGSDKNKIKEVLENHKMESFKGKMVDDHSKNIESKENKIKELKKKRRGIPLDKQRAINKQITQLKNEVDSHWKNVAQFSKSEEIEKGGVGSGRPKLNTESLKQKYSKWGSNVEDIVGAKLKKKKRENLISRKSELDDLYDILKAAPKGVDPEKHERCVKEVKKQGHDIGSAYAICTSSMKKKSFVTEAGPGGIVMDFGDMTGNPVADNFTMALKSNGQPEQMSVAKSQSNAYRNALKDFVKKGKDQFEYEKNGTNNDGQLAKGWDEQFHNVDQQTVQALQRGEIDVETQMAHSPNQFNFNKSEFEQTQTVIGGKIIKAQSETDVELIKLMSQNMAGAGDTGGTIVDAGGGGITIDMDSGTAFNPDGSEMVSKSIEPTIQSSPSPKNVLTL